MTNNTIAPKSDTTTVNTIRISDHTIAIFTWVVVAGLCQTVDIFGVVTNIVNITCFTKQGFKEPINISLCGLAVSDIGCLVTQMLMNIFYTLEASTAELSFRALEVAYLTIVMPHLAFNRVNIWITVIITLERCLCITVPLKMKHIVTTKRMWIIICAIYIIFLFSGVPVFAVNRLDTKFYPAKNRTLLGLVFTSNKDKVERLTFAINNFLLPFVAFIIIIICTVILVLKLRNRTKWLETCSTAPQAGISSRDQKVAKMVVMVSVLFIICFIPLAVVMLGLSFEPRLALPGPLFNVGKLLGNIVRLMESVNSSANIFIYYRMSKKYRDTFQEMFYIKNYKIKS